MVFIVTALYIEAKPIIEFYKLTKRMDIHEFEVFHNDNISLIISGTGKIKSAIACTYLLTIYKPTKHDVLVNIGFCGTNIEELKKGTVIMINKVTDNETKRDYYPDVFINYGRKYPVTCFSHIVKREETDIKTNVDMESTGIMEVCQKFIYSHQVVLIKIVSDYLSSGKIDKAYLNTLIVDKLHVIDDIIKKTVSIININEEIDITEETKFAKLISDNIYLSDAMKIKLLSEVRKSKIRGLNAIEILNKYAGIKTNIKTERKEIFERILQELKQ